MEYEISINEFSSLFVVKTNGPIDLETERLMLSEVVLHPRWDGCFNLLFDRTESTLHHLTADDIKKLSELMKEYSGLLGNIKIAIVLSSNLNFGLGRMLEAYMSYDMKCRVCILHTTMEAEHWLDECCD